MTSITARRLSEFPDILRPKPPDTEPEPAPAPKPRGTDFENSDDTNAIVDGSAKPEGWETSKSRSQILATAEQHLSIAFEDDLKTEELRKDYIAMRAQEVRWKAKARNARTKNIELLAELKNVKASNESLQSSLDRKTADLEETKAQLRQEEKEYISLQQLCKSLEWMVRTQMRITVRSAERDDIDRIMAERRAEESASEESTSSDDEEEEDAIGVGEEKGGQDGETQVESW